MMPPDHADFRATGSRDRNAMEHGGKVFSIPRREVSKVHLEVGVRVRVRPRGEVSKVHPRERQCARFKLQVRVGKRASPWCGQPSGGGPSWPREVASSAGREV